MCRLIKHNFENYFKEKWRYTRPSIMGRYKTQRVGELEDQCQDKFVAEENSRKGTYKGSENRKTMNQPKIVCPSYHTSLFIYNNTGHRVLR